MPLLLVLWEGMGPVHAATWGEMVDAAQRARVDGDADPLTRVLFLLAAPGQPRVYELAPEVQRVIAEALAIPDGDAAQCAARLIELADDAALDATFLDLVAEGRCDTRRDDVLFSHAVAVVVARRARLDLLQLVNADYGGAVVGALAEGHPALAVAHVEHGVDAVLAREVPAPPGDDFAVVVPVTEQGLPGRWSIVEDARHGADDRGDNLPVTVEERDGRQVAAFDLSALAEQRVSRRLAFQEALERHRAMTRQLDVRELYQAPSVAAFRRAVAVAPERAVGWVEQIDRGATDARAWRVRNFGAALAGAYAAQDADAAARLLRRLRDAAGPVRFCIDENGVELWDHALFTAPAAPAIAALRREVFDGAATDAALETLTTAAEECGASVWLDGYVRALLGSDAAGDQARAVAICGLRRDARLTDEVLGRTWGGGFLGDVARQARHWRERAAWAATWIDRASAATAPSDYWRFGALAVGVADVRHARQREQLAESPGVRRFGRSLIDRLEQASERRTKRRAETLFGQRVWDRGFIAAACAGVADRHVV